jgi:hypothetical protein
MAAKRLQISTDGSTWYTFPGSTGAKKVERAMVQDTIFGQNFMSELPTLGQSDYSGDSYFKGIAGYNAQINQTGSPLALTDEPTTMISSKKYQITNLAKRLININQAVVVNDNGVNQTANVKSIDYLSGTVVFNSSYVVTGPVTIGGHYLPFSIMAKAKKWSLTQTAAEIDASCYDDAQANGGLRTFESGLQTVKLQLDSIYNAANNYVPNLLANGLIYITADLEGATNAGNEMWAGMFYYSDNNVQGNVGALEDDTTNFDLYVSPSGLMLTPFNWYISGSSTLSMAVQIALSAWLAGTGVFIQYLPTGVTGNSPMDGWKSAAIVTESSLANDSAGQNTFTFKFRATGAITNV